MPQCIASLFIQVYFLKAANTTIIWNGHARAAAFEVACEHSAQPKLI